MIYNPQPAYDIYGRPVAQPIPQPVAPTQSMQMYPKMEITQVNGEQGAKAFASQMGPDSNAMVLDSNGKRVWFIQTDGARYPTIAPMDLVAPEPAPPPVDMSSINAINHSLEDLNKRIGALEGFMHEFTDDNSASSTAISGIFSTDTAVK